MTATGGHCPRCEDAYLERTYLGATPVIRCAECMGHWLPRGELQGFFKSPTLGYVADHYASQKPPVVHVSGAAQCAECRIPMRRARPAQLGQAAVDVCPRCGGTWLDGFEFQRALAHVAHGKGFFRWLWDTIDQVTSIWQMR